MERLGRPAATFVLAVAACGGEDRPVVIEGFDAAAERVTCVALRFPLLPLGIVSAVALSGDTLVAALFDDTRSVAVQNVVSGGGWSFEIPKDGPNGVLGPVGVALVEDTLVVVGDRPRQSLRYFDRTGRVVRSVDLDILPMGLATTGSTIAVAAAAPGRLASTLLRTVDGTDVQSQPVPVVHDPDQRVMILANMVSLTGFPDGRVILAHQFFRPIAHVWRAGELRTASVPVPPATARQVGYVPPPPLTEDVIGRIARIALSVAPDPRTGDLLVLTAIPERRAEKAVLRLDPEFRHVRSHRIDVNAGHLLYRSATGTALVVDDDGQWFGCPVPRPS